VVVLGHEPKPVFPLEMPLPDGLRHAHHVAPPPQEYAAVSIRALRFAPSARMYHLPPHLSIAVGCCSIVAQAARQSSYTLGSLAVQAVDRRWAERYSDSADQAHE
jgi:hypothetical protein